MALVLTLLVVAMLTVVVVGFTAVSRLEQVSARNMTYQSSAEQLAQLATGKGMQRLSEAMQTALAAPMFSSQPGQINPFGAQPERLFSSGGQTVNANRFTANGLITGSPADNVGVGLETVNDGSGNPIGRIAYYIDDESTKIAVNQATGTANRALNPQWPRPFAIQGAQGVNAVRASAFNGVLSFSANTPSNSSNWAFFFTPEQLRGPLTAEPLPQLTVAVETNPASINTTPWGAPKLRINQVPLTDAGVQQVVQALSDPALAQVFGQTFADKYTPEGLQQIAANMLQLRTDHWRGGVNFQGVDPVLGGSQISGSVNAPPESGMLKKTNGIPTSYMGYVPFPMLSEVGVSFAYGWEQPNRLTVRVFLECELHNPFPIAYPGGGQIYAQIDKARFQLNTGQWYGPNGTSYSVARQNSPNMIFPNGCDPWGSSVSGVTWWAQDNTTENLVLNPASGYDPTPRPIPRVPAGGYAVETFTFDVTFTRTNIVSVDRLYVIIDQIKLLASSGDPSSIRDWCSGNDIFNALTINGAVGDAQFEPPVSPLNGPYGQPDNPAPLPATPPGGVRAISKLDPRLRPSLDVSLPYKQSPPGRVWQQGQPSIGLANSGMPANFANDPIPSDPGDAQSVLYNSNFPPILSATNDGSYAMAADLGKVFTGLPWRNLRMQPQPSREASANLIPDWVMLDAVSFGDGTRALNAANPNTQIISASAPVNRRTAAIRSQLDVLTNQTLNIVAHPINVGATNTAPFAAAASRAFQTNATGINQIAVNAQQPNLPASWSASSSWRSRRAALGFPANALLLPSEMAEIRGVADFATLANSNKVNEYRLSALFPGAGARSRFYRITALGEALEGKSANAPSAARAVLQTLVEVNTNSTPPSIRIINQYPPAE